MLAQPVSPLHAIHRWMHLFLCLVWLSAALSFGFLALDAQRAEHTTLPRYQAPALAKDNLQIDAVKFQDVVNGIADAQNQSAAELETSIRVSAAFTFRLDLLSCIISATALISQAGQFLHEQSEHARRLRFLRQHP